MGNLNILENVTFNVNLNGILETFMYGSELSDKGKSLRVYEKSFSLAAQNQKSHPPLRYKFCGKYEFPLKIYF